MKPRVAGLCWWKPEQWDRLLEISVDRDDMEPTYESWRKIAETVSPISGIEA